MEPMTVPPHHSPRLEKLHALFDRHVTPHINGLNIAIAALLGLITVGFAVTAVLMILTATNFNILTWIE